MKARTLERLIGASYREDPPEQINGWVLDKDIGNRGAKVYYNKRRGEAAVVHRGTQGIRDWQNNLVYLATGQEGYKRTSRFERAERIQNKAEAKYGRDNITTIGHSQGAIPARMLGDDTKRIINVNPAYLLEKPLKNEYTIRSEADVVSALYPKGRKQDIVIPAQNRFNLLEEHSYKILDRLGNATVGKGVREPTVQESFRK